MQRTRPSTAVWVMMCAGAAFATGCAPEVIHVSPSYRPVEPAEAAPQEGLKVALDVKDVRLKRGTRYSKGGEVIAKGDKSKIVLDRPYDQILREGLTTAFQRAGVEVDPGAPVVVAASLRRVELKAKEFTHDNLDDETGSTLDAVRVALPRKLRPTTAEVFLDIEVHKQGKRLALAHRVDHEVEKESRTYTVLEPTLGEALSQAIDEAVRKASTDIPLAVATPVSVPQVQDQLAVISRLEGTIDDLNGQIKQRESQHEADRQEIRRLTQANTAERAKLAAERDRLTAESARVGDSKKALAAELAKLEAIRKANNALTAEQQAALNKLKAEQKAVADQQAQLQAQTAALTERKLSLDQWETNLSDQRKAVSQEAKANDALRDQLTRQRGELQVRQQDLRALEDWLNSPEAKTKPVPVKASLRNAPPQIAIQSPEYDLETATPVYQIEGLITDDHRIIKARYLVNGREMENLGPRLVMRDGVKAAVLAPATPQEPRSPVTAVATQPSPNEWRFRFVAPLKPGVNVVQVEAWDDVGFKQTASRRIRYTPGGGDTLLVVIGINDYQHVPKLKFAVNDAKAVRDRLAAGLNIPDKHVTTLLDADATLENIKHVVGEQLKKQARKYDTVVIFFSGHGASEVDAAAPDGSGVAKYLLPVDAKPDRLLSSAISTHDLKGLLSRLYSERVVFILDSCYAGAAGRTITPPQKLSGKQRAAAIDGVVAHLQTNTRPGRIIMAGSRGNEVAQEDDDLGHGVFSHFLVEGLDGRADADKDKAVTITELYQYVTATVTQTTNNEQTPLLSPDRGFEEITLSRIGAK